MFNVLNHNTAFLSRRDTETAEERDGGPEEDKCTELPQSHQTDGFFSPLMALTRGKLLDPSCMQNGDQNITDRSGVVVGKTGTLLSLP